MFTGLLTFLYFLAYFLAFATTQGWTPCKKILGLSVHGPGGAPKPTAHQSAIAMCGRWPAGVHRDCGDRGGDQRQPDQTGKHDELAGGTHVAKG